MKVPEMGIIAFVPPAVPSDPSRKGLEYSAVVKKITEVGTIIKTSVSSGDKTNKELAEMYFNFGKLYETGSYYSEKKENVIMFLAKALEAYGNARRADPSLDKRDSEVGKGIDRVGYRLVSLGAARIGKIEAENPDLLKSKDVSDLRKQNKHKKCIIL